MRRGVIGRCEGIKASGWWLGAPAIIKLAFLYIWGGNVSDERSYEKMINGKL